MKVSRRFTTAGSVFMLALATGFVMQHADALASRFGTGDSPPPARFDAANAVIPTDSSASQGQGQGLADAVREVSKAGPALPSEPPAPQLEPPAMREISGRSPMPFDESGIDCAVELKAVPTIAAMVDLTLAAPCAAGATVTISHGPLIFTQSLGDNGSAEIAVPALERTALFELRLPDGSVASARADVPDAERFERVALQWQGDTGLQLHAFEFGAGYGQPGHVHAGAPKSPGRADLAGAGFLVRLGNGAGPDGFVAEVYSFPASDGIGQGTVRIAVEAEVTPATCGQELRAEALRPLLGRGLEPLDLALFMPGCDSIGEFLVLNNVLRDMRFASY